MNKHNPIPQIEVNELSTEQKKSMKSRIITALILILVGVPCLFLGSWFFLILVLAILSLGIYEVLAAPKRNFPKAVYATAFVLTLYFVYWIFVKNNVNEYLADPEKWKNMFSDSFFADGFFFIGFHEIYVSSFGVIAGLVIFFLICFMVTRFTVHDVCYFFAMCVLLGLGFQAVYFMRYYPFACWNDVAGFDITTAGFRFGQSAFLIIYLLIGVFFNDIGAYFTGVLFGRNKVNPRISPKKTWEGVIGGGVVSMLFSIFFALIVSWCGLPILPFLSHNEWYWVLLISFAMVLLSNLGDFSFSAIKRFFNTKDYSNIFKEHGGVLDRFDSTLFSAITVATIIILIAQGWNFFK